MELQNVPLDDSGYITCLEAVQRSGLALQFVPEDMKTINMCQKAVDQNSDALKYVPDSIKMIMHSPALRDTETLFGMPAYICSYGVKHYKKSLGCCCTPLKDKVEVQPFDEQEPNLYDINAPVIPSKSGLRRDSMDDGILEQLEEERQAEINKMIGYYTHPQY